MPGQLVQAQLQKPVNNTMHLRINDFFDSVVNHHIQDMVQLFYTLLDSSIVRHSSWRPPSAIVMGLKIQYSFQTQIALREQTAKTQQNIAVSCKNPSHVMTPLLHCQCQGNGLIWSPVPIPAWETWNER